MEECTFFLVWSMRCEDRVLHGAQLNVGSWVEEEKGGKVS